MLWAQLSRGNLTAPLFCVAAAAVNHAVFRLGAMSTLWPAVLVLSVALIAMLAPHVDIASAERQSLKWFNVALGLVVVAPLIVVFAISVDRDFPFSGDHYGHVGQVFRLGFWWLSEVGSPVMRLPSFDDASALLHQPSRLLFSRAFVMALIVVTAALIYRRRRIVAFVFVAAALLFWGVHEYTEMLRYPGGGYLVALPFLGPAFLFGEPDLAGRTANVIAPVVWLFVLRPWLVGRWPDWRVVAVGALLLWHKDVIYYFNSAYLEPWAVIFALLAVEVLIERGARGAPLACLLVGAAATVKEPFIVALPFVWLAGAPWRQTLRELCTSVGAGLAAGIPFVIYFAARKNLLATTPDDARDLHFAIPSGPAADYAHEFFHRVAFAFPGTSAVLLIGVCALIPFMIARDQSRRLQVLLLAGGSLALLLLFIVENISLAWLGYFRFLLPAFALLGVGLFAFGAAYGARAMSIAAIAVMLLQAPSMVSAVALAAGPATRTNFVENYDAPIFFPVKSLTREARRQGWLMREQRVWANAPDTSLRSIPGLPVDYGPPGELSCACSPEKPAVMALFVRYANLAWPYAGSVAEGVPSPPRSEREQLWRAGLARRPACLVELRQTCSHVLTHIEDGELVTILGLR